MTILRISKENRITLFLFFLIALLNTSNVFCRTTMTYHGRLSDPSGNAVTAPNVSFLVQIRSPGPENCILYEELQTLDLSTTKGGFSFVVNSGSGTRRDSSGIAIEDIFSNNRSFTFAPGQCASGATYTPATDDSRNLYLYFNDGTFAASEWEALPATTISAMPRSIDSMRIGGYPSTQLIRVANGVNQSQTQLSSNDWTKLLELIAGTSNQYASTSASLDVTGTITSRPSGTATGQTGQIALRELASNGTNSYTIKAPDSLTADRTLILPDSNGASGQVLSTDGSGVTSWVTALTSVNGFINGGNSFGAASSLGNNDAFDLNFETNGITRMTIGNTANTYNLAVVSNKNTGVVADFDDNASGRTSGSILQIDSDSADNTGYNLLKVMNQNTASTKFVVRGDGYVGIGTANPSSKLDVTGYANVAYNSTSTPSAAVAVNIKNTYGTANQGTFLIFDPMIGTVDPTAWVGAVSNSVSGYSDLVFGARTGASSAAENMRITNAGNVGIGTTTPAANLHVMRTGSQGLIVDSSGAGTFSSILVSKGGSAFGELISYGSNNDFFVTSKNSAAKLHLGGGSGGDHLVIDNIGNVGIGTTTPVSKLDVNGDLSVKGVNGIQYPSTDSGGVGTSIAIGPSALVKQSTLAPAAYRNIAIGSGAMSSASLTTSAVLNIAIGTSALSTNTSGFNNVALGHDALGLNSSGTENTAVGLQALTLNSIGIQNTGVGFWALRKSTGGYNTAVGSGAGMSLSSGDSNSFFGEGAGNGAVNYTASRQTFIGRSSGRNVTGGSDNTALGYQSGRDLTTGSYNILIGSFATTSVGITTGNNNILIGQDVRPLDQTGSNQLNIGNLIYANGLSSAATDSTGNVGIGTTNPQTTLQVDGVISPAVNNMYTLGDSTYRFTQVYATNGAINTSDRREKKEILDSNLGLDFIRSLRPVSYRWNTGVDSDIHYGFIAQEIEQTLKEKLNTDKANTSIVNYDEKADRYGVRYSELIGPIVKSIHELYQRFVKLEDSVTSQSREIASKADTAEIIKLNLESAKIKEENEKLRLENSSIKTYLCKKDPTAPFCN